MKSYRKTLREFFKDFEINSKNSEYLKNPSSTEACLTEIYLRGERVEYFDYREAKVKGYSERTDCFGDENSSDHFSYKLFEIYLDDDTPYEDGEPWCFPEGDDNDDLVGWD